jgi:SulP family sulfate permease
VGIVLGLAATVAILLLSDSRRVPAALAVVLGGVAAGLALGGYHGLEGLHVGPHLPRLLPFGLPDASALTVGLVVLALPQLPMTVGNAVIAQHDLSREYFGDGEGARSTPRAWAVSMGLANLASAAFGGMPLCHGAGGLAAHYAFGARTGASNLFIGCLLVAAAFLAGDGMPALLGLLPFSVLGALLVFAGLQLGLMIQDVRERIDLFVVVSMLGIALATNLAIAFGCGFVLVLLFRHIGFRW